MTISKQIIQEKLLNKESFILKFYAEWCAPCKAVSRILSEDALITEVINVDIDTAEGMDLAHIYNIRNIPAMVKVVDGIVERNSTVNAQTVRQFLAG